MFGISFSSRVLAWLLSWMVQKLWLLTSMTMDEDHLKAELKHLEDQYIYCIIYHHYNKASVFKA